MSEPMLAEIATVASARPTPLGLQTLRVWLGQNKQDLATATGFKRANVERWELGDEVIPTPAWEQIVEMVNDRLAQLTKQKGAK